MTKLSANHLFDAMRSSNNGQNLAVRPPRAPAILSVEKLATFLGQRSASGIPTLVPRDLAYALRDNFDLEHDRIVANPTYLLDLPTVPTGRRLRYDSAHDVASGRANQYAGQAPLDRDSAINAVAEELATALGVAQARTLLHRSNWVLVVVDARATVSPACLPAMRLLAREPRMLVIWCEPGDAPLPAHVGPSLEELLAESGLPHLGPLDGLDGDDLSEVFQALKRVDRSCLVRLRMPFHDAAIDPWQAPAVEPSPRDYVPVAKRIRTASAGSLNELAFTERPWEDIEAVVAEAAAAQSAVVVIDFRPGKPGNHLKERLAQRFCVADPADPHVWQWCGGLAAGGCQLWFLIADCQWFETATCLAASPDGSELCATAIVFGGRARRLRRPREPVAFLREATFAVAGDLDDFARLLSFSHDKHGLLLVWAPMPAGGGEAKRELRVDSSPSAWLQRQKRAGRREQREIVARRFSEDLAPWIAAYESVGRRRPYIWRWCLHGVELTTLSCVPEQLRREACDTKVLGGMFNVLVDDVADQQGNGELLAALRRLVHGGDPRFDRFTAAERRYGEFTGQVWAEVWRRAKRYPCYDPYASLLEFDLAQLFNTVHYSQLVNSNPYLLNVVEHDDYSPQGMGLLSFAMIDLMCSPQFIANELGKLREAMWHAQWMARIGNLISTWQREVGDRDFSSGVFAHAVAERDLTIDQLMAGDPQQISAAIQRGGHEEYFLRRWKRHRAHLQRLLPEVQSVDLGAMLRGLERLLQTELVSRGEK
ncbi:MAG TPA: hypothetical protein VFI31_27785 [Pirellulales bacterium]|nr:hypothetical protein [Pirellulales bacterium]